MSEISTLSNCIFQILNSFLKSYKNSAEDEPVFPHLVYEYGNSFDDDNGQKKILNITIHSKNENAIDDLIETIDNGLKNKKNIGNITFYVKRSDVFSTPLPIDEDVYRVRLQYYIKLFS